MHIFCELLWRNQKTHQTHQTTQLNKNQQIYQSSSNISPHLQETKNKQTKHRIQSNPSSPKLTFNPNLPQKISPKRDLPLVILLMDKILHHQGWWLSHYSKGFNHPNWCRISSINSMSPKKKRPPTKQPALPWRCLGDVQHHRWIPWILKNGRFEHLKQKMWGFWWVFQALKIIEKNNLKYNSQNSFPYHVGFAKPVCFYLTWFGWLGDSLARCFTWHCLKSDTHSVSNSFFRRENNLSGIKDVDIACVQFWGRQVTFELSWTASVGDGQMWCVPWVYQISPKKTTEVCCVNPHVYTMWTMAIPNTSNSFRK